MSKTLEFKWVMRDSSQSYESATVDLYFGDFFIQVWKSRGDDKFSLRIKWSERTMVQTGGGAVQGKFDTSDDAKFAAMIAVNRFAKIMSEINDL